MKSKYLVIALMLVVPAFLVASGGGTDQYEALTGRTNDYFQRIFNFVIFAGILYYLLANPIKEFFKGRQEGIANQLKEIEAKLQASRDMQKEAEARVESSKVKAVEIVDTAHKEATILKAKIEEKNKNEIEIINKTFQEKITLEERRVVRETVDEILGENISNDDIHLDEKKVINLIDKKVA
jgi:F-type H+-transporting ATPase subunit b